MAAPDREATVHVLDEHVAADPPRRHVPVAIVVASAFVLFVVQLVFFADTGDDAPTDVVEGFVEIFNQGDGEAISAMLSDEPSFLSWPAGPPWGGGLALFVELVPVGEVAQLDNAGDVRDVVRFHAATAGDMRVEFCFEQSARLTLDDRTWVSCRFSLVNDLSEALDSESPEVAGTIRFGLEDGAVDAIVVEDVADLAPSGIPFLLWIKAEHEDVFDELLNGRITVPDYRPATGRVLLELAREYGAEER